MNDETALYRHFSADGELLYVGVSRSVYIRVAQHRKSTWFRQVKTIEIEYFEDMSIALAEEARVIKTEDPVHNRNHSLRYIRDRNQTFHPPRRVTEKERFILDRFRMGSAGKLYSDLARESKMSTTTIQNILKKKDAMPSFKTIQKLEKYLKKTEGK